MKYLRLDIMIKPFKENKGIKFAYLDVVKINPLRILSNGRWQQNIVSRLNTVCKYRARQSTLDQ